MKSVKVQSSTIARCSTNQCKVQYQMKMPILVNALCARDDLSQENACIPGLPVGTYPKNETPLIVAGIFKFGEMQPSIWNKNMLSMPFRGVDPFCNKVKP